MCVAGISVVLLAAAGIVATVRSIADSDASIPTGNAPSAYGSALRGFKDAHAKDSPTRAVMAPNVSSRRNWSMCPECGVVESIRLIERSGAAVGAMGAGNARIDRGGSSSESGGVVAMDATTGPAYEIRVRFRDGSSTVFKKASSQAWQLGSHVIVVGRSNTPRN
jgi:hypothetical protein